MEAIAVDEICDPGGVTCTAKACGAATMVVEACTAGMAPVEAATGKVTASGSGEVTDALAALVVAVCALAAVNGT